VLPGLIVAVGKTGCNVAVGITSSGVAVWGIGAGVLVGLLFGSIITLPRIENRPIVSTTPIRIYANFFMLKFLPSRI